MKIQVIGLGTVGLAQCFLAERLGHKVFGYDIVPKNPPSIVCVELVNEPKSDVDLTFICTPESEVENVVVDLQKNRVSGLYVIKSTVSPGATENLARKYELHICHNPEFLREKFAFNDVMNPDRIIIGQCCKLHGNLLAMFYSPLNKPTIIATPLASELTKLISNAYLATQITFWNEINELCQKLNLNTKEIAAMVCLDKRISKYGTAFFGKPFQGKCLPKDLEVMILAYREQGLNPAMFEIVKKINRGVVKKCS